VGSGLLSCGKKLGIIIMEILILSHITPSCIVLSSEQLIAMEIG
jgi:hypothetical protein